MRADLVERDLAALQQLHEERSRHVEHVRCVLGRQFGLDRDDADCVTLTDFGQDVNEQSKRRHRDADRMGRALVVEDIDLLSLRTGLQEGGKAPGRALPWLPSGTAASWTPANLFGRRPR